MNFVIRETLKLELKLEKKSFPDPLFPSAFSQDCLLYWAARYLLIKLTTALVCWRGSIMSHYYVSRTQHILVCCHTYKEIKIRTAVNHFMCLDAVIIQREPECWGPALLHIKNFHRFSFNLACVGVLSALFLEQPFRLTLDFLLSRELLANNSLFFSNWMWQCRFSDSASCGLLKRRMFIQQ